MILAIGAPALDIFELHPPTLKILNYTPPLRISIAPSLIFSITPTPPHLTNFKYTPSLSWEFLDISP